MSEASIIAKVVEQLVTTGPVAVILGFMCYVLYKRNIALGNKIDYQHELIFRLALRTQRAIEALAGISEPPEVEEDLRASGTDD